MRQVATKGQLCKDPGNTKKPFCFGLRGLPAVNSMEGRPAGSATDVYGHPRQAARYARQPAFVVFYVFANAPQANHYTCPHSSDKETEVQRSKLVTPPASHWSGSQTCSGRDSGTERGRRQKGCKRAAALHYETLRYRAATA